MLSVGRTSRASTRCRTTAAATSTTTSRRPTGDHRQRVLRPRRPPALGQRLVLHPLQLRQVQARRAAGPGELLPAHAGGGRRPLRSRAVHRRHPEHQADDARRRVQLLEGLRPTLVNELRIGYANTAPFTTQSDYGHYASNPWGFTASTSATSRPASRTSASRTSPAFPADRRSCRSTPASSTTRSRTSGVAEGRHQLKFGYRLVDRRPSPFIHDNTRSAINFGTSFVNNPLTSTAAPGWRRSCSATSTTPRAASCWKSRSSGWWNRARSCRTTSRSATG